MNLNLPPSTHYEELHKRFKLYSQTKTPIILMGCNGSYKDQLLSDWIEKGNYEFSTIDCLAIQNKEDWNLMWKKALDSKISINLQSIDKIPIQIQYILFKELQNLKTSKSIPWIVSLADSKIREMVSKKSFLEDLFIMLGAAILEIQSIHYRKKEILQIAKYYLDHYSKIYKKRLKYFDDLVIEFIIKFDYPGDLEQLNNLIHNSVVNGKGRTITIKDIPTSLYEDSRTIFSRNLTIVPGVRISEYEKEIIKLNLKLNNGNREKTAKILDISLRTLYRKIDEYNLKDSIF